MTYVFTKHDCVVCCTLEWAIDGYQQLLPDFGWVKNERTRSQKQLEEGLMRQRQIWPEYSSHLSDTLGQVRVVGRENGHISVTRECYTPLLPKFACLCLVSKYGTSKVELSHNKRIKTPWIYAPKSAVAKTVSEEH
jgi:hypothetical protein